MTTTTTNKGVEALIEGLRQLRQDLQTNPETWQNRSLEDYLESIEAWLDATKERAPVEPTWEYMAGVFGVGKIYE